eukprot:646816-Amphidinium_carterae.1
MTPVAPRRSENNLEACRLAHTHLGPDLSAARQQLKAAGFKAPPNLLNSIQRPTDQAAQRSPRRDSS